MPATRSRKRSPVPEEFRTGKRTPTTPPSTASRPVPQRTPFTDPTLISERQWKFICDLLDKKDLFKSQSFFDAVNAMDKDEYAAYIRTLKEQLKFSPKRSASDLIETLKVLPYKPRENTRREQAQAPKVEPGRYALRHHGDELNPVRFYTVREGKDRTDQGGKDWSGYTFVDRHVSDERYPVKGKERYRVLEAIAADPLAAAQLYAAETNACSTCGKELTRRLSRAMGKGPICAAKSRFMGVDYIETTRQQLYDADLDPDEVL